MAFPTTEAGVKSLAQPGTVETGGITAGIGPAFTGITVIKPIDLPASGTYNTITNLDTEGADHPFNHLRALVDNQVINVFVSETKTNGVTGCVAIKPGTTAGQVVCESVTVSLS